MNDEFDVIWRRGDDEMPEKAKLVVNAAREARLLKSLNLTADEENTIRYRADKSNKTVSEYISTLVIADLNTV